MKKILTLIAFLLLIITCRKDDEPRLSDFMMGMWKSYGLDFNGKQVTLYADIRSSSYKLSMDDGNTFVEYPVANLEVSNNYSYITTDIPDFDTTNGVIPIVTVTFYVEWATSGNGNAMVWFPVDQPAGDNSPPVIIWIRNS